MELFSIKIRCTFQLVSTLEDPFIKAIAAYDSNMRYDLCKKQVKKEIPIRLLKKIISFILIHI